MAALSRSIARLSARESEARRGRLRAQQHRRDVQRLESIRKKQRQLARIEGLKGAIVLALIIAFFALVYWAAMVDLIPRPVDLVHSPS